MKKDQPASTKGTKKKTPAQTLTPHRPTKNQTVSALANYKCECRELMLLMAQQLEESNETIEMYKAHIEALEKVNLSLLEPASLQNINYN